MPKSADIPFDLFISSLHFCTHPFSLTDILLLSVFELQRNPLCLCVLFSEVMLRLFSGRLSSSSPLFALRSLAKKAKGVPAWTGDNCTQCLECVESCPHETLHAIEVNPNVLGGAPEGLAFIDRKEASGLKFRIQVNPEHCTGCSSCVDECPESCLELVKGAEHEQQIAFWKFIEGVDHKVIEP
uniref:Pyruvate ferredoxin oxidoreductase 5 n=1 Tax=Stygiella incarcerata TaxID=1712417 RepID=A0A192ZJ50_9EUKA|nr:pyruvate ferredoxin oxidoreductase 5 [Stygiella incarcerata]ANM86876.1 pyruvate ferredoxin oxidoreductase 5 [Stygiella incarcerata]